MSALKPAIVPIFSATGLGNDPFVCIATYRHLEFQSDTTHGTFDASTGQFTAATAGLYQFSFNGVSWQDKESPTRGLTKVELRIDSQPRSSSIVNCHYGNGATSYSLSISAVLQLKRGNVVDAFVAIGRLGMSSGDEDSVTRFSGILLRIDEN